MLRCTNRFSVFRKVLLLFILLVFPMYMSSFYLILRGQSSIRKEILKAAEAKASFYMSSLEAQLYNVMQLQLDILNDKNIDMLQKSHSEISEVETFQILNQIRNTLWDTANMNQYIKEITVYLPVVGKKVTTQSILPIDNEEYYIYLSRSNVENLPFCLIGDDYYMNMTPQFYGKSEQLSKINRMFVVSICISKEAVLTTMKDIPGIEGGNVLLISDGRGLDFSLDNAEKYKMGVEKLLDDQWLQQKKHEKVNIEGTIYYVFFNPSSFLHSVLVVFIPESNFLNTLKMFSIWIWVISALMLLLVGIFSFWLKGIIAQPLKRLMDALEKVEVGTVDIQVEYSKNDEFGHIYRQFNYLVNRLKELVSDVYRKELMLKEAEFKQLQYQINPHFLYNSLLIVSALVQLEDVDCALKLIRHLSSYYQYITKEVSNDVELIKEVSHARDYCEVQNIRFQGRITAEFDELPEHMRDFRVPRLILQPIIENAYKHGLKNKLKDGMLKISYVDDGKYFRIVVEDNGEELTEEVLEGLRNVISQDDDKEWTGTGIKNVHNRLRMRFKGESGVRVERSPMGGLRVSLVMRKEC